MSIANNTIYPILLFFLVLLLSAILTKLVQLFALYHKITDKPSQKRKIHKKEIPLLGGLAIFFSFFLSLFFFRDFLTQGNLDYSHWLGFFIGACFLMIGGFLDDKYNLKPKYQLIFPILASLSVIIGGVGIEKITNPIGGYLFLDFLKIPVVNINNITHYFVLLSDLLIIIWLMVMMYTTKLLDGLDGLVTGTVSIGALVIFLFTTTTKYYQPDIGVAALILFAACLGFLIFNWNPASIFLGEGGSLFLGYALGVLAIISGGKIAIALLVLGLPILDMFWTIIRRLKQKKNPFKFSDRKHLHHRLLDLGLGQKRTVLLYYFIASIFGISALFLQSSGKIMALGIIVLLMFTLIISLDILEKKKSK